MNQLWAQAYALYRAGEAWRLTPEERDAHGAIVELYEVEDVMEGYLQKCFRIEAGNEALFSYTTEIIDTLKTYAGATGNPRGLAMQLSTTLNRMGLGRQKRRDTTGSNRWGYVGIAKSID